MIRKNMKNCNAYEGGALKMENEPEEGEIVDDYDLIVSSDEELSMRQRIRELEAENEEIEQIAVISRSYVDKIRSRAAQVPSDVSSISSTEFVTPKKRKRRKSREHKRRHNHRQHQNDYDHKHDQSVRYDQQLHLKTCQKRTHCKKRQKLCSKKHKKIHSDRSVHKIVNSDALLLESLVSSDSSSATDTEIQSPNFLTLNRNEEHSHKGNYITRDTLRLAVARNTNESRSRKYCLKDKLLRTDLVGNSSITANNDRYCGYVEESRVHDFNDEDDDVQVIENEPDIQIIEEDSTDSMEEKELRLIALKSAVLKKHNARKKRNAAVAYSPTDFDEMLSYGIVRHDNKLDDIDVVDLEAEDSQTACVILSPDASPQLMILEDQEESQQMVDCKPVDMDIANSDSEDVTIDSWSKDAETFPKYSRESYDFVEDAQYEIYMQKLQELPPPPPGVDDYEDAPQPPPYHMLYIAENQEDMDLDNEELTEEQFHLEDKVRSEDKLTNPDNIGLIPARDYRENEDVDDEDEEEVEALRALLLSKFQSPKCQKKVKCSKDQNNTENLKQDMECKVTMNEESKQNQSNMKPTEFILKEAVKRLKTHSQLEVSKEERSFNFCSNDKYRIDDNNGENDEHNSNSLNMLEKLKSRLSIYKSQSEILNTDQLKSAPDESVIKFEQKETAPNAQYNNEQTNMQNDPKLTNKIDVSDITRRLQKIKENVLNSKYNIVNPNVAPSGLSSIQKVGGVAQCPNEYTEATENVKEINNSSNESDCQLNKPLSRNVVNTISANKTVKANFDVNTNKTTFKVTITNNDVLKSEDDEVANTINDISYKENNAKNVQNNLPLKVNGNQRSKAHTNSERLIKINTKIKTPNVEDNAPVNKSASIAKPIANAFKVEAAPTLLRATKIVKPNKVINTNFDLNPKKISQTNEMAKSVDSAKPEMNNITSNAADNSRLITSLDQVKQMCKVVPFVISLQNSSNESSDDESGVCYNSLYKPLYDYNDNTSPLSLNLESPSFTPLRSNSPVEPSVEVKIGQTDLEASSLKTKIVSVPKVNEVKTVSQISSAKDEKVNNTPLAVRHLPAAAQSEYRRLVHRMKLLENKRKLANIEGNQNECTTNEKAYSSLPITQEPRNEKDKADSNNSLLKTSLVKKVLLKNASNNTATAFSKKDTTVPNVSANSNKLNKSNVLRSYENLYAKFGAGIVNNLDKSLKLVHEAKKAKIAKLKLENRLKELKAEMDILQAKHKEEQQKISRIYPNICTTNEVITSLKQKRSKVFKAALNLGKTVKGGEYRLNNDLKDIITTKSKTLATEIKAVNSLNAEDIGNLMKANSSEPQQTENCENKFVEERNTNSEENNGENKLNANTTTNNTMICSKICKEEEENNNLEPIVKTDEVGGNTEFQNTESNDSKTHQNVDTCLLNKDLKLNNACAEKLCEQTLALSSYISPLEHLRNIDSNMDPNGIICPYDLMGNCEDAACKYVHITSKAKT